MSINVVFTGAAHDGDNNPILRRDLSVAARSVGLKVQGSVQLTTHLLVASRGDTRKASSAREAGVPVVSYDFFIDRYLGGYIPSEDAVLSKTAAMKELGLQHMDADYL